MKPSRCILKHRVRESSVAYSWSCGWVGVVLSVSLAMEANSDSSRNKEFQLTPSRRTNLDVSSTRRGSFMPLACSHETLLLTVDISLLKLSIPDRRSCRPDLVD